MAHSQTMRPGLARASDARMSSAETMRTCGGVTVDALALALGVARSTAGRLLAGERALTAHYASRLTPPVRAAVEAARAMKLGVSGDRRAA